MRVTLRHKQQHLTLEVHREPDGYRVALDGHEYRVDDVRYLDASTLVLNIDGRMYRVDLVHSGSERLVAVAGETYRFLPEGGVAGASAMGTIAAPEITSPMPGKVLQVLVTAGDHVIAGDGLLILEAMKMENRLVAEAPGTVTQVRVAAGDMVDGGQVLIVLSYEEAAAGNG